MNSPLSSSFAPLSPGTMYNPFDDKVKTPPTTTFKEGESLIRVVANSCNVRLDAGQKVHIVGTEAFRSFHPDDGYDATVEGNYINGVPPGWWFRVVLKNPSDIIIEKLDQILDLLNRKGERHGQ